MQSPARSSASVRAEDTCARTCPVPLDLAERVARLERQAAAVATAFVLNDLKTPDYDGHRKEHLDMAAAANILKNYKISATQKVIASAVALVVLLISTGLTTKLAEILKGN